MKSTLNDFKAFILRGNVIDLAVAVLIGAAFGQVVQAFTTDIISPLITLFGGSPKGLDTIWIFGGFKIGPFLDVVLSFLITAAILFFFVVRPVNYLMSFRKTQLPVEPTTRECPYCVSAIPLKATRCAFCTAEVPALEPVAVNKA